MLPRFYAPEVTAVGVDVALPADDARHLRQILRLSVGAEIVVFDGRGREFLARVVEAGRAGVTVRPLEPRRPIDEPRVHVTLAVGALKAHHLDAVVRDATMLGVAVIQPLVTGRTNVPGSALRRPEVGERWRRIAIASAKQCQRAVLPLIRDAVALGDFVREDTAAVRLLCVEPSAQPDSVRPLSTFSERARPRSASLAIGSEGGWSGDEVDLVRAAGFELVSLGQLTLRADAVPIVAIAALRTVWGDW